MIRHGKIWKIQKKIVNKGNNKITELRTMIWKIWKKSKLKCEMISKYGRNRSRIVIRYGQYGRKAS